MPLLFLWFAQFLTSRLLPFFVPCAYRVPPSCYAFLLALALSSLIMMCLVGFSSHFFLLGFFKPLWICRLLVFIKFENFLVKCFFFCSFISRVLSQECTYASFSLQDTVLLFINVLFIVSIIVFLSLILDLFPASSSLLSSTPPPGSSKVIIQSSFSFFI